MDSNTYLIPANSKRSQLIFGVFRLNDLIIFVGGASLTLLLLIIIKFASIGIMLAILLPLLISALLIMPIPNYHNILQLLTNVFKFYFGRKKYLWKGWCIRYEDTK